jgi:surfactin synthase thioesterase subunit
MTLDKWVPFRNEGSVVRCRLFCFPHAAGNAAFYRPLRRFMPPEVDFCPVELPGRAARLGEPPFTSMSALMEWLDHALQPLMGVPFGFFGHSVGACMAFEAARQLRSVDGRIAVHHEPPECRLTTVEVSDDLYRRAKAKAALRGRKLKNLVEEGLRLVLEVPREMDRRNVSLR